jgi:hypothetical protein
MTDLRNRSDSDAMPAELREDLHALRETTSRSIPEPGDSMLAVRTRRVAAPTWKELVMPLAESIRRRSWLATAGLAAAAAVLLSIVPVSYTRTTGHDVSLTLAGIHDVAGAAGIARELKAALKSGPVAMKVEPAAAGATVTLETFVPASAAVNAGARASALAKELAARGYDATAAAAPHRVRVSGNVYAFARDLVVRVETEGKTAAQIESEIRAQIAAAGIAAAQVMVTDSGNQRKVTIQAERHGEPGEGAEHGRLDVELTKNGAPLGENGSRVEIRKIKSHTAGVTLQIAVTSQGRTTNVEVPNVDTMSDADLAARIRTALRNAGVELGVKVENGQVMIGEE